MGSNKKMEANKTNENKWKQIEMKLKWEQIKGKQRNKSETRTKWQ